MYKKGSCYHLDDWIDIVKNHKQPVNIEQVQLIALVEEKLQEKDVIVDITKINDCIMNNNSKFITILFIQKIFC